MDTPENRLKSVKNAALSRLPPVSSQFSLPGYLSLATKLVSDATFCLEKLPPDLHDAYVLLVQLIAIAQQIHKHNDSVGDRFSDQMAFLNLQAKKALILLERDIRPALIEKYDAENRDHARAVATPSAARATPAISLASAMPQSRVIASGSDRARPTAPRLDDKYNAPDTSARHSRAYTGETEYNNKVFKAMPASTGTSSSIAGMRSALYPNLSHLPETSTAAPVAARPVISPVNAAPSTSGNKYGDLLRLAREGWGPEALPRVQSAYIQQMPVHDSGQPPAQQPRVQRAPSYGALTKLMLAGGQPVELRRLDLPTQLIDVFEHLALVNSQCPPRGIETCGVLCGKPAADPSVPGGEVLRVTTLIVPAQAAGPDHCEVLEEGELALLEACQADGLQAIGWVHTHPSQGCFMSSLDCHTHCGYQSLLPEAVAVVIAPRSSNRVGIFRLTDDPTAAGQPATSDITGLMIIQSCDQKGFHPHPEGITLYEGCEHVRLDYNATVQVKDLRPRLR